MSKCKTQVHVRAVNMHFIVLLCIFTGILANRDGIFDEWENSQVFIYKKNVETQILKPHLFISEIKPSCFGILLTTKFVITAISCFFDVTQLNDPNVKLVETLKFDPEKAFVVIVIIKRQLITYFLVSSIFQKKTAKT
jgi:hypothetical protein